MPPLFTKKQMETPIYQNRNKLSAVVVDDWCSKYPELPLQYTFKHLGILANAAIDRAARHGVTSIPEICVFSSLMWLYGPTFDTHPRINAILSSSLSEKEKIEMLLTRIPEQTWSKIDRDRDEGAWFEDVLKRQENV